MTIASIQLMNAALGGKADETISSRVGRARDRGSSSAAKLCDVLDWLDPRDGDGLSGDHCSIAVRLHEKRLQDALKR